MSPTESSTGTPEPSEPEPEASAASEAAPSSGSDGERNGVRVERTAATCFLVATVAAIALAVVYVQGGQTQWEGVLLAVICGAIGIGIILWAKHFMPHDDVAEEREPLVSSEEEIAAFTKDFEAGESNLGSRRLLLGSAAAALTAFGAALLFPIRSLGPRPGRGFKRTAYADGGKRVVTEDGEPVRPTDLAYGGVVTVWPEGHIEDEDSQTLLIRPHPYQEFKPRDGREDWTVDRVVAYSKLCTHVGCPVGLYEQEMGLLLCPCHQSTFDVLDGARPVFGPAARSLPQLQLQIDDEGYLVAPQDFSDPVGPGFWDRGR